jgi:hypothetical protein
MTIINNGVLNVKAFLDSIDESENTIFKLHDNGNYYHITYKQLMQSILKGRTDVTLPELISLTSSLKYRIDGILEGYKYYSKTSFDDHLAGGRN